jgi:hypothetical protein
MAGMDYRPSQVLILILDASHSGLPWGLDGSHPGRGSTFSEHLSQEQLRVPFCVPPAIS